MLTSFVSFFVTRKCKKIEKWMQKVNIHRENLHFFWKTWGISMKFSEKMWLAIILSFFWGALIWISALNVLFIFGGNITRAYPCNSFNCLLEMLKMRWETKNGQLFPYKNRTHDFPLTKTYGFPLTKQLTSNLFEDKMEL